MNVEYNYKDEKFKVIKECEYICFSPVRNEHEGRYISFVLPALSKGEVGEQQLILYKDMIKFWKEWLVKPKPTFKEGVEITVDMSIHNLTTMLSIFTCFRHMYETKAILPYYVQLRTRRRLSKIAALCLAESCNNNINSNHGLMPYGCIQSEDNISEYVDMDLCKVLSNLILFDNTPIMRIDMSEYNKHGKGLKVHATWGFGLRADWYCKFKTKEAIWKKLGL